MMKKILTVILSCAMMVFCATSAFSAVRDIASERNPLPALLWNLSSQNHPMQLTDLATSKSSYTRYFFTTGTGKITVSFQLQSSGTNRANLKAHLYEKINDGSWTDTGKAASVIFSDDNYTATRTFDNLDTNRFYFLAFANESETNSQDGINISGEIVISE